MGAINQASGKDWTIINGDCCEVMPQLPENSMGFSVFSPPFSNLFVYSNSERDMGNCATDEEFMIHLGFMVKELFRITIPGRLSAVHCIDLPLHKFKDGVQGLKDFPGMIIKCFQENGWIFHSRVTIWKDPVVEMARTKAHGLLHKTICKDSTACRQGCADYLVVFRKPTDCAPSPVIREKGFVPAEYIGEMKEECVTSVDVWQRYASPVWFDIRQTRVLNAAVARSDKDERHICPLQLDVIERCIHLWTNPGDVVFTPFCGIGSEVYSAVNLGRKGVGIELKPEYYAQSLKNMAALESEKSQCSLFDCMGK